MKNRWIGSSGQKEDLLDALKLAQLARGGYIKEIHHPLGQRRRFRELMIAYHDTVRSTTRIKNKIKAKFRQNGIQCTGKTVYLESYREEWKRKLPQEATLLLIPEGLWRQLEQSEQTEKDLLAAARAQVKQYPGIKHFEALPSIGFISEATISAILETPYRFADKRKVWMYAGLGIMTRSSGGKTYSEILGITYCASRIIITYELITFYRTLLYFSIVYRMRRKYLYRGIAQKSVLLSNNISDC